MKKILLLVLLTTQVVSLYSQFWQKKINCREVIVQREDTLIKATILTERIEKKAIANRTYSWYYKGNINYNSGGFTGNLLHGECLTFFNDKLIISGSYDKGLKSGKWIWWYNTGKIMQMCTYKNGLLNGRRLMYDENGAIISESIYRNGIPIKSNFVKKLVFRNNGKRSSQLKRMSDDE